MAHLSAFLHALQPSSTGMDSSFAHEKLDTTSDRKNEKRPMCLFWSKKALESSIYTWLTHPLLDPQKSGRVIMDHLMKLITTALEWSYAQGEKDASPKHLEAAAEQLTLRRD